jgi:hypothetical protein
VTHSGIVKNFVSPVALDTTTDYIASKLSAALQAAYKDELCQNYIGISCGTVATVSIFAQSGF